MKKQLKLKKTTITKLNDKQMKMLKGGIFGSRVLCPNRKTKVIKVCGLPSERTCFC